MADDVKKSVIIEVDLEGNQNDFAKLARYKQALAGIKDEQKNLNEALKKEAITEKEYFEQLVELEAKQKRIAASYSEVQRGVTGLQSPFEKLNSTIKDHANQMNVAGFSLSTFANPVTATIGVLGGLYAAYGNSTRGAKDLEFVTDQLGETFHLLTNAITNLITSGEDGEGLFTNIYNGALRLLSGSGGPLGVVATILKKFSDQAKEFTKDSKVLEDLQRDLIELRAKSNDLLEKNADIQTEINDLGNDYAAKLAKTKEIDDNIKLAKGQVVDNLKQQLAIADELLKKDSENENLQEKRNQIYKELTQESRKFNKLEEQNLRQQNQIVAAQQKANDERAKFLATWKDTSQTLPDAKDIDARLAADINRIEKTNEAEVKAWETKMQILEDEKEATDTVTVSQKKNFEGLSFISNALGGLSAIFQKNFKLNKAFASAQAAINSFLAGTFVLAENSPFKGPGARIAGMIAVIAAGLAQQIRILATNINSSGGGTGSTSGGISGTSTGTGRTFLGSGINFSGGIGTRVPGIASINAHAPSVSDVGTNLGSVAQPYQDGVGAYTPVLVIEDVENKMAQRSQIKKRATVSVNG